MAGNGTTPLKFCFLGGTGGTGGSFYQKLQEVKMVPQEQWTEDDFCGCGALLDADGKCPYCTYTPEGYRVVHVYDRAWEVWEPGDELPPLYYCHICGGAEDGCTCGQGEE